MVSDTSIIATACLTVAVLVRPESIHVVIAYAGVAMLWILLLELCRTRSPHSIGVGVNEYRRLIDATAMVAGTTAVIAVGTGNTELRVLIVAGLPAGLACLLIERWTWRKWLWRKARDGHSLSQVVVVGSGSDVDYVIRQLGKNASPAYLIVGTISVDPGAPVREAKGIPRFTGLDQLEAIIPMLGADAVIVAGPLDGGNSTLNDLSWRLEKSRTQVIVVSSLTNVAGPRISVRPVEGLPLMHVDLPSFSGGHHIVKRAMDVVLSAVALLMLAPMLGVLAVLIRIDSKGPVIFAQERIGTNGQAFRMYKFRSMVVNAEEELEKLQSKNEGNGLLFKLRDDPRVTKAGVWLRKFSLDELPQIYNVLRGEMSLVGPRPPLPKEVAKYEGHVGRRLYIKPGLTGLWQVSGRSDLDWEEGVRLDLYYVENWSVTGDLMIMWRTFKVMLHPIGAY